MPNYPKKDRPGYRRVVINFQGRTCERLIKGSKADADDYEARMRLDLVEKGAMEGRVAPIFSNFCADQYRAHALKQLKKRTWTNRQYTLRTLAENLGDLRLTEITRHILEQYQTDRLAQHIRPTTINDEMKVFRAVRAYAKALYIPVHDCVIPDLPVRGKRSVHAWVADEVDRLLRAIAEVSPDLLGLVLFLLNTGCRKGEAIALEWSSVDLARRLVSVEPNEEWQPKNGESRQIPISDALLPVLSGPRRHPRFVFPTSGREKVGRYAFWPQRAFDRAREAAGLAGGPHTTRHTFATHFLSHTPDLYLLARLLGHSDIVVTRLYAHLLPDHLDRARSAVSFASPLGSAEIEARRRWKR